MELTKDSKKLVKLLYKQYHKQRKSGQSKSKAAFLGSSHNIHQTLCPKWRFQDVDDACRELSRTGFLKCVWADNIAYQVQISNSAIVYMESRSKNCISVLIDFIAKFIP